jgi:maltose alpha-D-glucosyltransferase/alpha-amylase
MTTTPPDMLKVPAWLEKSVFYQIYPQSFHDSNGDGIGDIRGVIEKLPYLRTLGITGLWLSPCFVSPFRDAGYDISDFYQVAPRYGTNDDLTSLFTEARKSGIRVILDLVAGHTSDQHPWFRRSSEPERNVYSDWYIWTDSIWTWKIPDQPLVVGATERNGNYVPNFFCHQPALNYGYAQPDTGQPWQQPVDAPGPQAVRAELKAIMRFWFDRGASGFRVDMAGTLVKNDPDGSANAALWREFRTWIDREYPDCALVSEWSQPSIAIPQAFHMDFLLPYNQTGYRSLFAPAGTEGYPFFDRSGRGDIRRFLDMFEPYHAATRQHGFIAIPTGNHDTAPRLGNGRNADDLAVVFAFLLTMPGVPFIYYGDELGLRSPENLLSKEGGHNRTAARIPMRWDATSNAGFSSAAADELYLPADSSADSLTVAAALSDSSSLLHTVSRLVELRRVIPALAARGNYATVLGESGVLPFVYERTFGSDRIVVALNPAAVPCGARLPGSFSGVRWQQLTGDPQAFRRDSQGSIVSLAGVSFAVARIV